MENQAEEKVKEVVQAEKYCSSCGHGIKEMTEICPNCGVRQLSKGAPNGKNRLTTALLAFFLGAFGVHRFYLGNILLGFLYLLFFWTLIPAIISFIEFIIFICMSDEDFNKKYGQLK